MIQSQETCKLDPGCKMYREVGGALLEETTGLRTDTAFKKNFLTGAAVDQVGNGQLPDHWARYKGLVLSE